MRTIESAKKELARVELELDKCRTSTIQDGWQTQKFARKSRNWDYYAKIKIKLIQEIEKLEIDKEYQDFIDNSSEEQCPECGEIYNHADFDFQTCSVCGLDHIDEEYNLEPEAWGGGFAENN